MICMNCKTGADLRTRAMAYAATHDVPPADVGTVICLGEMIHAKDAADAGIPAKAVSLFPHPWPPDTGDTALALAAKLHEECRGSTWCDCQHTIITRSS